MLFNSFGFLLFIPFAVIAYYVFPKNMRWIWLLVSSYLFYLTWNAKLALILAFSTVTTYVVGIFITRTENVKKKKFYIVSCIAINVMLLYFFKYYNFTVYLSNKIFSMIGMNLNAPMFDIIVPMGISFYTFKVIGYIIDCYRSNITAEKNLAKYALFVSFFPELLAGPIDRSTNLLPQISQEHKFDDKNIRQGLVTMLIGFFIKLVIADRLAIVADSYFNSPSEHYGYATIIAIIFYSFQIYCDFLSYSTIALGVAKVFGYDIIQNFKTPYLSKSIKEFWHRWHISLSSWFRDYLYIPLGGSRVSIIKKYRNILIVFLVSGLWHGASLTFIIWGTLHGIYQIIGDITKNTRSKFRARLRIKEDSKMYGAFSIAVTFLLVTFAWIFFRANSLNDITIIIKNIFKLDFKYLTDPTQYYLGLDKENLILSFILLITMFIFNLISVKHNVVDLIVNRSYAIRFIICFIILISVLIFGIYGPGYDQSQFIYTQF